MFFGLHCAVISGYIEVHPCWCFLMTFLFFVAGAQWYSAHFWMLLDSCSDKGFIGATWNFLCSLFSSIYWADFFLISNFKLWKIQFFTFGFRTTFQWPVSRNNLKMVFQASIIPINARGRRYKPQGGLGGEASQQRGVGGAKPPHKILAKTFLPPTIFGRILMNVRSLV